MFIFIHPLVLPWFNVQLTHKRTPEFQVSRLVQACPLSCGSSSHYYYYRIRSWQSPQEKSKAHYLIFAIHQSLCYFEV